MRMLSCEETDIVSGANLEAAIIGLFDGASTGMAIGGKWGGAGGFIVGGIAQLFGLIIPTIMGGIAGFIGGAITDTETIMNVVAEYRNAFGPGDVNHGGTIG
ncbi:hypothetical protein NGC37_19640 [Pantoea anthophila]|uniref:DUF5862 family protein n=1 Tax=Pantoea anthophila TaxID=470931 RepID=UPI002DBB05A1|nr:hypothetical protein [Pantoea anthophila]MEB7540520.1 hypothetical protein [Pantoea anthophila]